MTDSIKQSFCLNTIFLLQLANELYFQINAVLKQSLQFSKLQHLELWASNAEEEVDQGILDQALEVIPNVMIH